MMVAIACASPLRALLTSSFDDRALLRHSALLVATGDGDDLAELVEQIGGEPARALRAAGWISGLSWLELVFDRRATVPDVIASCFSWLSLSLQIV